MRTVKLEDLKKLAATAGSDEVLTVSSGDLFTAPLSTVLNDYSTKVSLGNATAGFATQVSLGAVQAIASSGATQVSLGAVQSQVSLCATTVSLGNVDSRVTALEQFSVPVVSLGNPPSPASDGDLAVIENGSNDKGSALAFYHNNAWYRASDNVPLTSLPSSTCVQDPSYAFPTSPNNGHQNNYTFAPNDRPLIVALQTTNGLTQGVQYTIYTYNVNSGNAEIFTTSGVKIGWVTGRGTKWEVLAC